jgi:hypothetical protein
MEFGLHAHCIDYCGLVVDYDCKTHVQEFAATDTRNQEHGAIGKDWNVSSKGPDFCAFRSIGRSGHHGIRFVHGFASIRFFAGTAMQGRDS